MSLPLNDLRSRERARFADQRRFDFSWEDFDNVQPPRFVKPRVAPRPPRQRRQPLEARLRLATSGIVPSIICCGHTTGEVAVLAVITIECKQHGECDLTQAKLGWLSNASRKVVQNAIYEAERRGNIAVERSKIGKRNRPNIITIVNKAWLAWMERGPQRSRAWVEAHQSASARAIGAASDNAQPGEGIHLEAGRHIQVFSLSGATNVPVAAAAKGHNDDACGVVSLHAKEERKRSAGVASANSVPRLLT
jgi:hypothetical protein